VKKLSWLYADGAMTTKRKAELLALKVEEAGRGGGGGVDKPRNARNP
jgi:hypothetical protein